LPEKDWPSKIKINTIPLNIDLLLDSPIRKLSVKLLMLPLEVIESYVPLNPMN
jgi:hypothetical protein